MVVRPVGIPTELQRELTAMADAGLGGVEVAYVYPLSDGHDGVWFGALPRGPPLRREQAARSSGFASTSLSEAAGPFGGPHVSTEFAAGNCEWVRREIGPESLQVHAVVSAWPGDELVAAYVGAGSLQEQPDSYER